MSRIKNWKKTVNNEYIDNGGGFKYNITFYRHLKNSKLQIEIFEDLVPYDEEKDSRYGLNIGILPEYNCDKYEFIQGDYIDVKSFSSLKLAKQFAIKFMKNNPNGVDDRNRCPVCEKKVNRAEQKALHLSNTNGIYYKKLPKSHVSQGWFFFHEDCYNNKLKEQQNEKNEKKINLEWKCHTMNMLKEIVNCALPKRMGILFHPLNIFKNLLTEVATRASQINDPVLNKLMCQLVLYEIADPTSKDYDPKAVKDIYKKAERYKYD